MIGQRFKAIIAGFLFSFLAASGQAQSADQATIAYIANSGFLVSCRDRTILIDALFNQGFGEYLVPSPALRADMISGQAPFARIDALLITHADADHFNAADVIYFLKQHPETRLYASPRACAWLTNTASLAKQVIPIEVPPDGQTRIEIDEKLSVTAFRLKHTQDEADTRINYGYLMSLAGAKVFFTGDTTIEISRQSMEKLELEKENIDVFFIQYFDLAPVSQSFVRTSSGSGSWSPPMSRPRARTREPAFSRPIPRGSSLKIDGFHAAAGRRNGQMIPSTSLAQGHSTVCYFLVSGCW